MTSALSTVPVARRRRSATVAGGFAVLLLAAGVLPWAMPTESVIRFLAAFVVVAGLLAAFVAVGLLRSIKVAPADSLTRTRAVPSSGGCGGGCQCGHSGSGC